LSFLFFAFPEYTVYKKKKNVVLHINQLYGRYKINSEFIILGSVNMPVLVWNAYFHY
jgi:hypothetical protein